MKESAIKAPTRVLDELVCEAIPLGYVPKEKRPYSGRPQETRIQEGDRSPLNSSEELLELREDIQSMIRQLAVFVRGSTDPVAASARIERLLRIAITRPAESSGA